jgi:hypothetical protein
MRLIKEQLRGLLVAIILWCYAMILKDDENPAGHFFAYIDQNPDQSSEHIILVRTGTYEVITPENNHD